ncbi:zinc finger protein 423-like [Patiria miniata]|uniref:C2H2-type domain-containing protein n=1 Tax=Patiria miniata TaxID=46514 RepID=A0A914B2H0_PATMI|nr:zinc finger protein 423-like [Patiria miniata]
MREQTKLVAAEQCDQGAGGMSRRKQAKPRAVKRGPFLKGLAIGEAGPSSRPDHEVEEDRLSFLSDDTRSKKARSSAGESSHLEESTKSPTCSHLKTFCDDDNDSIASESERRHSVKPPRSERQSEELLDLEDDDPAIDDDVDDVGEDEDEEIYKCDTCNSAFLSIADFMDHRNYDCDTDIGIGEVDDSPSKFSMSGSDEGNSSSELLDPDSPYTLEQGSLDSNLPYHCQFCDRAFHRLTYLKRHEQVHSDKMPFKCTFCSRLFKHKRSRDRHVKLHTGDKKYQCPQCDASFSRSDHLKIHLKTHTTGKPFRCPICNRGYTTNAALMAHTQNFHKTQMVTKGKDYKCVHCSATFTTSENLYDHLQTHVSELPDGKTALYTVAHTNGEPFNESLDPEDENKCPVCEETLMSVDELQAHLDMHKDSMNIPLQCQYCPRAYFPSITVLNVHMKTLHSDKLSKIHQCQYCGKDYPTLFNLTEHMSAMHEPLGTHSNSSNQATPTSTMLSCAYCTMEFGSGIALRSHIDSVHSIPNAITYDADGRLLCPRCSMGFLTEQALYEHFQNSHGNVDCQLTNDARVQCHQCTKVYPNHAMLQEHVNRSHSQALDSMKYPCPYCIKQNLFDSIEQLQLHVQVFHQSDRAPVFLCPEEDCKGHFDTADALSEHLQNDHNQENSNKDTPSSSKSTNPGKNKKEKNKEKGKHKEKRKSSSGKQTPIRVLPLTPPAEADKPVEPRPSSPHTDHSSQGAFSCPTCHNEFTNEEQLVVHVLTHYKTISAEYICKDCGKSFKKPDELQKHLFEIHAHHLYKCSLCKEVFDSKVSIQVHFAVKHSNECKLYSCMKCGVVYRSEGDLLVHVKFEHLKITQPFKCLFCSQSFASDVEFQCHLTSHSEQFRCPFCNAPYSSQETLEVHLRATHDYSDASPSVQKSQTNKESPSDKPTYSSDSDNNPKEANDMKHEEEGCFICKICDTKFPLKILLEKHHLKEHDIQARSASIQSQMSSVTAQTSEPKRKHKYPCDTCPLSFKTKYELMKHAIEHTAEFKLRSESTSPQPMGISSKQPTWHCKCYVCKQPIQMETEFLSHAQQHNEEIAGPGNTIRCVACLQILTSMVELQLHARYHTQAPPSTGVHELYPCYVCGKTFGSRTDVVPKLDGSNHPCFMCLNCIKASLESQFSGVSSGTPFVKIPAMNNHRCPKCSVKFETREELDTHLVTHGAGKTYQCIKCQQNFATEMEIQLHVTTHVLSEGVHLECKLCKDIFDSPAKLQCHLINHSFADKEYRCPICKAMFSCAQDIQAHAVEHGMEARRHKCSQCSQTFFFSAELQNHVLSHPSQEDLGIFRCEECRRVFSSSASLSNHSRLHATPTDKGFKCSICMEMFYSTVDLQQHYFRTHSEAELGCKKKSFKCGQCDEVFPCLSNLQGHMRIHTDGRKYTCTTCNKVFSLSRNLTIHMRSHSGEKPYQCPMCDKRFARKENRKVHLKSHTGIKPFMCPHCGKMFSRKCHVRDHMRTHTMTVTRGSLFQCEYCQETFTLAKNLRRHIRRIHKEEGTSQSSSASPLSSSESLMGEDETSPEMGASSESDSLGAEPIVSSSQDPQATEEMQIL